MYYNAYEATESIHQKNISVKRAPGISLTSMLQNIKFNHKFKIWQCILFNKVIYGKQLLYYQH